METVIIIGAGASGMAAALTAAGGPDRRVLLLERQQRAGRKLLATGNGRCNLTNIGAEPSRYHGAEADFVRPALTAYPPEETLAWFRALGLVTVTEPGGRVYPLSDSANSVVDVLRFALEAAGVELRGACPVRGLRREKRGGFAVVTDEETLHADWLIVACGGAAGARLGGVSDGYTLLEGLGHKRTALYPSLVPILTAPDYPRALKGVRADCALRLLGGEQPAAAAGELQFTETGVSGPVAFDLSRAAATGGKGLTLSADFLRSYSEEDVFALLCARREKLPALPASELLTGVLHNRLGRMLVKYAQLEANTPLAALDDGQLRSLARACKSFRLPVRGVGGFDAAQVTAGGVRTSGFNPETLESWFVPGLFACGEVLDVDGDCGGFNLQWAWSSGRLAGRLGT